MPKIKINKWVVIDHGQPGDDAVVVGPFSEEAARVFADGRTDRTIAPMFGFEEYEIATSAFDQEEDKS